MPKNLTDQRRNRYGKVMVPICKREEFTLDEIKLACWEEKPVFITRIVRELERGGVLQSVQEDSRTCFRWREDREQFSASRWIENRICGMQVTNSPVSQRPREKLLSRGAADLETSELLAILIRSGLPGESAVQAGQKLANRFADELPKLPDASMPEMAGISVAVKKTAFCQIMAGIELGRRVVQAEEDQGSPYKIGGSVDAIRFCQSHFARLAAEGTQEEFHTVTLDTRHQVISTHRVTVGTLNSSLVHPREVFRPAIRDAAAAVILVHNHPSGDPTPSPEDFAVTKQLERAGGVIDIKVLDHIIVAADEAVSVREYRQRS